MNKFLLATTLALLSSSSQAWGQAVLSPLNPQRASSAGERNGWGEHELPADFSGPGSANCLGTLVYFQTPSAVHLWSAITATWAVVPVSPTAQVSRFNAYAIIEDGPTVHGFATRTGEVESLQLASTPQLYSGSNTSCWLSVVALGNDAWAFCAFDGEWRHQALTNYPQQVKIAQTTALLDDGSEVYGISSYYGDFVPGGALSSMSLEVAGDVGIAFSGTSAVGFSAHTNEWASDSSSNLTQLATNRGYAMFEDGANLVAFSPCTGDFATYPVPVGFNFMSGRYVAAAVAGTTVVAYSSGQNTFVEQAFQGSVTVQVDDEVLAVHDDDGVTAFSVVAGEFSDSVDGTFNVSIKDSMVWVEDGTQGFAYGNLENTWVGAPSYDAQSQGHILRNAVVVSNPGGYWAFSGRKGEWLQQASTTPSQFTAPSSGDLFAGFDGSYVHIFDPVIGRWTTGNCAGPIQDHDLWRQTYVGFDGAIAHGYGLMNNCWSTIQPQGAFQSLDANSSAGMLVTDSHIYTYSAHGTLTTLSRFPEFSRMQPISKPLRLLQSAPAGSFAIAILALRADYVPFKPFGTLYVDRSSLITRINLGLVPTSGLMDHSLDLSSMPSLRGQALHIQNIIVSPSGRRWLTNSIAPVIL